MEYGGVEGAELCLIWTFGGQLFGRYVFVFSQLWFLY